MHIVRESHDGTRNDRIATQERINTNKENINELDHYTLEPSLSESINSKGLSTVTYWR